MKKLVGQGGWIKWDGHDPYMGGIL